MNFPQTRPAIHVMMVLTLILVSAPVLAADKDVPAGKAAIVNGVTISKDDFDHALDIFLKRASQRGQKIPEAQMGILKSQLLDNLIDRELLLQESKKKGIQVKPESVKKQLMAFKQRFPDEDEFDKVLKENNMTESELKSDIIRGLAMQQLVEKEVYQKIQITEEETKSFYDNNPKLFQQPERVKASHILIKVAADAPDDQKTEARKKIKAVQEKVRKGEDFATLAKTYSEGPSGPQGGDLGYFRRGQMVKPFEKAAFSLKPNETSDIVETKFGYHLIKVVDKKPAEKAAYADIKKLLSERLKKKKMDLETEAYIKDLRSSAKIEKFL
jgi:peptidyl-prolyl cis-trans isomerase C